LDVIDRPARHPGGGHGLDFGGQRRRGRIGERDMGDEAKRRRLANLRPFKPGQSGNPKGYSKAQFSIVKLAREHSKEAIDTLVAVMRYGKPAEAAMAANSLLDRA
jgi:hypothetical protein